MSRPLRIEYPGALYHVTSRGNAREAIYLCDEDRERFLQMWQEEVKHQGWICYAYCLMDNHYHLLFETPEGNLSQGMQRFNGRYTQYFNHYHHRVGHLFQGRYKAILVEKEAHLRELCRYVVLNPVRANMAKAAGEWPWSSYGAVCGEQHDSWLAVQHVQSLFGTSAKKAINHYKRFVEEGIHIGSPWEQLRGQIYLGGDDFIDGLQSRIDSHAFDRDITFEQRYPCRATVDDVVRAVMEHYGMDRHEVVDRRNKMVFRQLIFLLRRACNAPLREIASMTGISEGRVSQIHRAMLDADWDKEMKELVKKFNV